MYGFTYNGIHSSHFNIHYAPSAQVFSDTRDDYKVTDEDVAGRDGGYFVSTRAEPKEFTLTCYAEQMTEAQRWEAIRWLDRHTEGDLTLDESPYVTYCARPAAKPEFSLYQRAGDEGRVYQGEMTITFTAYDPKGQLTLTTLPDSDQLLEEERTLAETGLIAQTQMPYLPGNPVTGTSQLVYNPGTKNTPMRVLFKGIAGDGITIRNAATGEALQIVNVPAGVTDSCAIAYDSERGTTRQYYGGKDQEFVYLYHEGDYLTLAPGQLTRSIYVTGKAGEREITSHGAFTKSHAGRYIYINGEWLLIGQITDDSHATLSTPLASDLNEVNAPVAAMNYLTIDASNNSTIDAVTLEFVPRV